MSLVEAALGGSVHLDLPDDTAVDIDIPSGTQPGDVITVKSRGAPRLDGRGKGSLQVVMQVEIPKTLSPRAKELLRELDADLQKHSPRQDRNKAEKTA